MAESSASSTLDVLKDILNAPVSMVVLLAGIVFLALGIVGGIPKWQINLPRFSRWLSGLIGSGLVYLALGPLLPSTQPKPGAAATITNKPVLDTVGPAANKKRPVATKPPAPRKGRPVAHSPRKQPAVPVTPVAPVIVKIPPDPPVVKLDSTKLDYTRITTKEVGIRTDKKEYFVVFDAISVWGIAVEKEERALVGVCMFKKGDSCAQDLGDRWMRPGDSRYLLIDASQHIYYRLQLEAIKRNGNLLAITYSKATVAR